MEHDLKRHLAGLKLHYLSSNLDDFVSRATKAKLGPMEMLELITKLESEEHKRRSVEGRLRASGVNKKKFKPMADFDWNWPEKINRAAVESLFSLAFIKEPANVIMLGPAALGKSMIAKNLALQAVMAGHSALFVEAADMLGDLGNQETPRGLQNRLGRYTRPDVLVIDEVGYLSYSTRAGDLMFQVISKRYEQGSTIVTSNVTFKDWGTVFPASGCVTVMIDRLTHHAEIISIEGDSYRKKEAEERQRVKHKGKSKGEADEK